MAEAPATASVPYDDAFALATLQPFHDRHRITDDFVEKTWTRQTEDGGRGEGIMVRCHHNGLLDQVDAWIAEQDEGPSRPEAIRRPLAKALAKAKHDAARGN